MANASSSEENARERASRSKTLICSFPGDLHVVAHHDAERLPFCLEDHLDVQPGFFLLLQIVLEVVEGLLLEGLHPKLVVLVFAKVQLLLLEIDALGVGFLGVDGKLTKTVGQRLLQPLLPELNEEVFKDFIQIYFSLMGKRVGLERERNGVVCGPFYLLNIDFRGHRSPVSDRIVISSVVNR